MSSTSDGNNRITDEEQTPMGATTESNTSESNTSENVNDQEELMIVDLDPRRALRRGTLLLIWATYRAAAAVFMAWAGVHYFRTGVIEPWLNSNGHWYWFAFGAVAVLLLNEVPDSLIFFSDAVEGLRAVHWYARKVEAMPMAERLRAVPASELAKAGTARRARRMCANAGGPR